MVGEDYIIPCVCITVTFSKLNINLQAIQTYQVTTYMCVVPKVYIDCVAIGKHIMRKWKDSCSAGFKC